MKNRKVYILILGIILLIFIILVFYKNNKVEEVVSKEKSNVVEDTETGEYIIYDENNNILHRTQDRVEAEVYDRDSNFDMQMPDF